MAVSSIAHNADINATRLISTAPARRKEANIMNMRVKEAYSRDGSECQYQYVGEAGEDLVEQIVAILEDNSLGNGDFSKHVAQEIANLVSSSCHHENDSELLGAAEKILHLHLCEQEGIGAGQPSPTDWLNAVGALSDAINNVKNKQR